jgi:diketogulonate reductase-like aldo/keto reductase
MVIKAVTLWNGVKMPIFGLGTYKLTGKSLKEVVKFCIQLGIRHFDTATFYENEKILGEALKESKIERSELFITTKLWYSDHGYEKAKKAFEKSLSLLDCKYIDLYLIHWPEANSENNKKVRSETWKAFEELYEKGLIKAIGVSNYTIKHLKEMEEYSKIKPMVNQVEFHPRLYQKDLHEYCKKNNIILEAYSSLAKGKLLNDEDINKIAKKYDKSISQILLRWAIEHDITVIPKSNSKERMKENLSIFDFEIEKDDMIFLDSLNKNFRCTWDPTLVE